MGACYSKKASGGNRSYSTIPMASTKLDEASRLARPTPYTRTQNANIDFASKKGIPLSTKYNSLGTIDQGDLKNIKNSYQSNIPRFSTSLPGASVSTESKTAVLNCNDNETLHVVNNNAVVNSRSASNICHTTASPTSKLVSKSDQQVKPKSIGSKSCPDKIVSQESIDEKSRTPNRISGLPRQLGGKSSQSVSHISSDVAVPKYQQSKFVSSRNSSLVPSPLSKASSGKDYESKDSLSDFDSGFGNSNMTDKSKPEDSDTIKDMEQLVLEDSSPTNNGVDACPIRAWSSTPKVSAQQSKLNLKAPSYKREPNGKWSLDEKHFGSGTERVEDPKPLCNSSEKSPKEKHSFKMNASENIFSTYASYKGLLSYQKKSFKPVDHASPREAVNFETPSRATAASNGTNASCIPKIRKTANQTVRSSVFYVQNDFEKPNNGDVNKTNLKTSEQSPVKHSDSKQSSLDSDEKSDSTENGVTSPSSEVENREFLIDDEISDQPGLTFFGDPNSEESDVQSLKLAVSELHALQLASSSKRRTDSVGSYSSRKSRTTDHRDSLILGSDLGSSCSSIASDDLMLDYEKTFDAFPEGTVNEGLASPMKRIESDKDKIAPLRTEKKVDMEENHRKRLHRRSSGPMSSVDKLEWRQRTVSLPLRPPRQMTVSENDDGSLKLDSSSYRLLCQDLNGVKTLLLRLKSVIQEAETINPFDQANPKNIFYQSLVHNDFPASFMTLPNDADTEVKSNNVEHITQENADLKRQLVLLQQQLEEKDHTIHLLQQQMTKYLNCQVGFHKDTTCINAATQTERGKSLPGSLSSSSSSADDSIETLVSVQDDFEKSFRKNSEEQDLLKEHLKEVARLLDNNKSSSESDC
ncbi:uncharacterized protein LOC129232686 [Uloborus diversus]|uniref:uncharacterized protein LOC129232686 n=1 Tax=Uloborus diversus TaxID=327109 RepID=UPI002409DE1A|nr:uncharacterized protein LOC129232686 [Uloborus diversus]